MKVIYANIIFFILVLYGLTGAALTRLNSEFWKNMDGVNTEYDLVSLIFAAWVLVTIVGLIMKKPWAYVHTLFIDAVIAVLPIILFIIALITLWHDIDYLLALKGLIYDFLFSSISFIFWLTLYKSNSVKNAYNKSLNQIGANDAPPG